MLHFVKQKQQEAKISNATEYYAILSDGGALTYGFTSFFAADESEAAQKAKDWAKSLNSVPENAWLQVTANGVGVYSLPPGKF